jgi:hypothetical protein
MPEDNRAKGQQYLQMASGATNSMAAALFRVLAEECFELAEQQQQPKKPEGAEQAALSAG